MRNFCWGKYAASGKSKIKEKQKEKKRSRKGGKEEKTMFSS